MEIERRVIRYYNKDSGICATIKYDRFFVLGYVLDVGVNVGISFKCESLAESDSVFVEVMGTKCTPSKVSVITDDGLVVQVLVDCGNGYSKVFGTGCFFGYIEDIFDQRPREIC